MFVIPVRISATQYSLAIVLQDDNITRIKAYDPAELSIRKMGAPWNTLSLKDIMILYATAEEEKRTFALMEAGDVRGALRLLSRGFKFRPDAGDQDLDLYAGVTPP